MEILLSQLQAGQRKLPQVDGTGVRTTLTLVQTLVTLADQAAGVVRGTLVPVVEAREIHHLLHPLKVLAVQE